MEGSLNKLTLVGIDQATLTQCQEWLGSYEHISSNQEFEVFLDRPAPQGRTIFCGSAIAELPSYELAQTLRNCFLDARLIFLTSSIQKLNRASLKKNGFNEVVVLPFDLSVLKDEIHRAREALSGQQVVVYKAVKLIDMDASQPLDFDIATYMPLNRKYIKLVGKGSALSPEKMDKLKSKSVSSLYIDSKEMKQFYTYCSKRLANLTDPSSNLSQTERSHRLQSSVRDLFHAIFEENDSSKGFDYGKQILDQSKEVVNQYVMAKLSVDLHAQIGLVIDGAKDSYQHASAVSSLACLFSMALGIGKPEDLAIAGLFHDLGLTGVHGDLTEEEIEKLSPAERDNYYNHPLMSLFMLREKRITVEPHVALMIEHHHERHDGKGFPKKMNSRKISLEAQLLSFVDQFERLTRIQEGQKRMGPQDAIQKIIDSNSVSAEITYKARQFFPKAA